MSIDYPTHPDPSTNQNLDSMAYQYHIASPKAFEGLFRSHTDLTTVGPPRFDYTWVPLSISGTTTRMLAVGGSEFWYTSPTGRPVHRVVPEGAICLVNPGATPNTYVVSVPQGNDPVVDPPAPQRRGRRPEFDLDPMPEEFAADPDPDPDDVDEEDAV